MREVLGFSEMLENLLFIFFRFGMYFKKIIFLEKNVFWNIFLINFSLKLFDRGSENLIFFSSLIFHLLYNKGHVIIY